MIRVFIINLAKSVDRKNTIKAQISSLFNDEPELESLLKFEFFSAIDGSKEEHLAFNELFAGKWGGACVLGRELSIGEFGCGASHLALWKECVRLNEPIIVLEDDVLFSPAFTSVNLEKIISSNYEYIRFYYLFDKKTYKLDDNFYLSFENIAGTQGYFLRPSAATKFIAQVQKYGLCKGIDDMMDMSAFNNVLNVIFKPFLLDLPSINESTLSNRKVKIKPHKKLVRELFRLYFNIKKFIFKLKNKKLTRH